jgi:two-component system, NtrC family, C4-dicarboxylate transport sensor histidine kinase DctB
MLTEKNIAMSTTKYLSKVKQSAKWLSIAICVNMIASGIFYFSLLISSSNDNAADAKIYEQSLTASINQFEYLPALLASDTLFINALLYSSNNHLLTNKKLTFIAERAGADVVYIMNSSGTVVASSNYLSKNSFLNNNYAFRPYFQDAIKQRKRQFYYAKGATTGIPGFFISEPIIYNDQTIGVAVVKLNMSYWEDNWRNTENTVITADNNDVIILSSIDQWRYRTIGELSAATLNRIGQLQQFGNKEHESLYTNTYTVQLYRLLNLTFWEIDNELYLSQHSSIPEVNWSLYYLVKNQHFLYPTFIFFIITNVFFIFTYLIRRERKHRIASINKNQRLELIRQEELKTVMDNIHVGVTLFTETGQLVSINDHAKYLLFQGHSPHPKNVIHINDIISIEADQFDTLLLNNISSATYHEAYALNNGKKTTPIMFALSKVNAMDTELYLMTFINIKRRKAAEDELVNINNSLEDTIAMRTQELQKAQATLIQKNKAAALGNMAATIVHELSQPLSAINSSASAVSAKINNQDWNGAKESANRLNPLSKKMHNVINLLKHFSYQDNESQQKTDLMATIHNALNSVSDIMHDKKIHLDDSDINQPNSNDIIYVEANPLKLDLVISNIIKNAMDAAEKSDKAKITVAVETSARKVFVHISDNGGGIDPKIMNKLFSPYFTTKEVGKGLGLGLSISYEIIQEYDGNISAKNINNGMCFTIQLPCYIEQQSSSKKPS